MTMNHVKVDKTFGRKYKQGKILATRIDNYPIWITETFGKVQEQRKLGVDKFTEYYHENVSSLLVSRVEEFKELWGKQDFVFMSEYKTYNWVVECNGCEAIIFSGNGKGTGVEIVLNDEGLPKGSVEDLFFAFKEVMKNFPKKH